MKNTRKKLLVSSVAALLVSAMALSTATFAWFTTSTSAKADELSVKTVKSSELVLAKTTGDWTDQLKYGTLGKVLKPASSVDGVNWFTATAASKTKSDADTSTVSDISNKLDGYVFVEQLNVLNKGAAEVKDVTIDFELSEEGKDGANYLRLALVPVDRRYNATDGLPAPTAENFASHVFAADVDSAPAIATATKSGETTSIKTNVISAKSGAKGSVTVGELKAYGDANGEDAKYYNLYVWFEGQDTNCFDANAGNSMPNITFTVSGDTVTETNPAN